MRLGRGLVAVQILRHEMSVKVSMATGLKSQVRILRLTRIADQLDHPVDRADSSIREALREGR